MWHSSFVTALCKYFTNHPQSLFSLLCEYYISLLEFCQYEILTMRVFFDIFFVERKWNMKDRIKMIRKQAKMTQVEFGEKIGVKGNTITGYETGLRTPSDAVIFSMCREFSVKDRKSVV